MTPVDDAVKFIKSRLLKTSVSTGIITGSGWDACLLLDGVSEIKYQDIPDFPISTVSGHKGRLLHGSKNGKEIILLQGRVHYYEGYGMDEVTFPVRVLSSLGVRQVIMTNSSGGIRPGFNPGDFMLVTDHINMMGSNPLRATSPFEDRTEGSIMRQTNPHAAVRTRFTDMTEAYDRQLADLVLSAAGNIGITLHTGTLAAVTGPSYETPAEIRMLRTLGADAVCMSTVPEVIMSRYLGIKVLVISMIANDAAGISASPLRHEDVVNMAVMRSKDASRLLSAVIDNLPG